MPHNTWSRLGCSVRYSRIPTTLNGALLQNIHRHAQSLLPTGWSACALWIGCIGIPSFRTEERNTSHFGPCLCVGWRAGARATLSTGGRRTYINKNPILFNTGWGARISAPASGGWILLILAEDPKAPKDATIHEVPMQS